MRNKKGSEVLASWRSEHHCTNHAHIVTVFLHDPSALFEQSSVQQQEDGSIRAVTRSSNSGGDVGGEIQHSDVGGVDGGAANWAGGGMGGVEPQ